MRSKQMTIIWIPPDLIEPPHKTPLTLLMCGVDNHIYISNMAFIMEKFITVKMVIML